MSEDPPRLMSEGVRVSELRSATRTNLESESRIIRRPCIATKSCLLIFARLRESVSLLPNSAASIRLVIGSSTQQQP
jgi:hypothetical protein